MKNKKRITKKASILIELVFILFYISFVCAFLRGLYSGYKFIPFNDRSDLRIFLIKTISYGVVLYITTPILKNMIIPNIRQARTTNRLQNTGIKIRARVINVEQTGVYQNELPEFEFQLEYSVPGHEKLMGSLKRYLGYGELDYANRSEVEIFYDPDNPKNISWTTIDEWKWSH